MTVSPRRLNDQLPTANGPGDPVAADAPRSDQVPPTLFRLPNLNSAPTGNASTQQATNPAAPIVDPIVDPNSGSLAMQPAGADAPTVRPAETNPMVGPTSAETMVGPSGPETMVGPSGPETMVGPSGPEATVGPAGHAVQSYGSQPRALGSSVTSRSDTTHATGSTADTTNIAPQSAPTEFPNVTEFPNIVPADDGPVGRSWMEVMRQHGVVVVLLLVVVATAVFTGRDPNPAAEPIETDLAELQQELSIDTGVAVDATPSSIPPSSIPPASIPSSSIPLPRHTHDLQTGMASSVETPTTPPPSDSVSVETAPVETTDHKPTTAVAALQPPQATASPTGIDLSNQGLLDGLTSSANSSVEATAVASRTENTLDASDSEFARQSPSLENLTESIGPADQSVVAKETASPEVSAKTSTPHGINNWLKYLPAESPQPSK